MADLSPQVWQKARISKIITESPRTKSFRFEIEGHYEFIAGQHCSIQLHAPNGYKTARDYSFSSAPMTSIIDITIAHTPHGEVSGWFTESAEVGDVVEISPPIGYYFNWTEAQTEPVLLIAGGVGVTPLMSMLREHQLKHSSAPMSLFYSVRNYEDICFKSELNELTDQVVFTLTETQPDNWQGHRGIITADMLKPLLKPNQSIYVCGPTAYVEAVDHILVDQLGVNQSNIKNERFG